MTDYTRKLRVADRPLRVGGDAIVLSAEDNAGWLEVWVPIDIWEALQAEAPLPCDGEDRRDYALGMIEVRAARQSPRVTAAGVRTVIVA